MVRRVVQGGLVLFALLVSALPVLAAPSALVPPADSIVRDQPAYIHAISDLKIFALTDGSTAGEFCPNGYSPDNYVWLDLNGFYSISEIDVFVEGIAHGAQIGNVTEASSDGIAWTTLFTTPLPPADAWFTWIGWAQPVHYLRIRQDTPGPGYWCVNEMRVAGVPYGQPSPTPVPTIAVVTPVGGLTPTPGGGTPVPTTTPIVYSVPTVGGPWASTGTGDNYIIKVPPDVYGASPGNAPSSQLPDLVRAIGYDFGCPIDVGEGGLAIRLCIKFHDIQEINFGPIGLPTLPFSAVLGLVVLRFVMKA